MRRVLWALILIAASAAPASAQQAVNLAFATLDTGSAWYVYGATMAEILRKTLPPGSNIDVKTRAGGVGNPRLVAKNETPLGSGFTVTKSWGGSMQHAGYTVIVDAFRDGRADVLFAVVTPKHPSITEIANAVEVAFLGLDAETIQALVPLGYVPAAMPAGTFKGQTEPVR